MSIITITRVLLLLIIHCASMRIRRSTHTLSTKEKQEYLDALYLMKSTPSKYDASYNAYDYFVYIHLLSNDPSISYGHSQWSFLPWHRIYLYLFESELQRVSNNTNLYLPYWNPTNQTESQILLYDESFLGGNGNDQFPHLMSNTSSLNCDKWPILPSLNGVPDVYNYTCLHRTIGQGLSLQNGTIYLYQELLPEEEWEDAIETYRPYDVPPYNSAMENFTYDKHQNSFRSTLEGCTKWLDDGELDETLVFLTSIGACQGLHGHLHIHIGGQLASGASPNDPMFFLLHNWVDLMWSRYQKKYGNLSDIPEHLLDIDVTKGKYGEDNGLLTSRQVLDHENQLGYIFDYDYNLDVESVEEEEEEDTDSIDGKNRTEGVIMGIVVGFVLVLVSM